jgi:myotubularin-related protein 1/2
MIEACLIVNNPKFIKNVVDSKWYDQVRSLLAAAEKVSTLLQHDRNVLVKCSDGLDRTTQICALAMILLDSYYRAYEGQEVLV